MLLGLSLAVAACGDEGSANDASSGSTGSTGGTTSDAPTSATDPATTSAGTTTGSTTSGSTTTVADGSSSSSDGDSSSSTGDTDTTDDVVEIAIRRLNEGQDVEEFAAARDAFVELLTMEPGVGTDREFEGAIDFGTFAPPAPPVFIGMTQYEDLDAFAAAGKALGKSPEAAAFFSTFTPEVFTALRPLEEGIEIDIAGIANVDGQVLEVAARDLSQYENFVQADYEEARDAFLQLLSEQDGFVEEYQWVSAIDPNIVVGMTVYEDFDAFMAINMDASFTGSEEAVNFLAYTALTGFINTPLN